MSISATIGRYRPAGDDKIPASVLRYVSARNRQRVYDLAVREFRKSGLTQAQLARRLDSTPDVISRFFSRPRNVEVDTLGKVIFAVTGEYLELAVRQPLITISADDQPSDASTTETVASNLICINAEENSAVKGTVSFDFDMLQDLETNGPVEVTHALAA